MIYVQLLGRLGADSELRNSKNGKSQFVSMRVASNDFIGGENVTTWVNVIWSGERAVKMQEHMKKGSFVNIWGTLRTSLYDTKNGEKAVSIDIFADRVDFVNSGSGGTQSNDATTDTGTFKQKEAEMATAAAATTDAADDLPF